MKNIYASTLIAFLIVGFFVYAIQLLAPVTPHRGIVALIAFVTFMTVGIIFGSTNWSGSAFNLLFGPIHQLIDKHVPGGSEVRHALRLIITLILLFIFLFLLRP